MLNVSKPNTGANHEFTVDKLPVNGCTPEQLEMVARLEKEIEDRFKGTTGMSGKVSPSIGKGWNLGRKAKEVRKEEKIGAVDMVARMNAMFK